MVRFNTPRNYLYSLETYIWTQVNMLRLWIRCFITGRFSGRSKIDKFLKLLAERVLSALLPFLTADAEDNMKEQSGKVDICRDMVHRFFEDPDMTAEELSKETRKLGVNIVKGLTPCPQDKQLEIFNEEKVNHER